MTAPKLEDEPKAKPKFDRDAMRKHQAETATRTWADPAVRKRRSAAIAKGQKKALAVCKHAALERMPNSSWMRCAVCGTIL